MIYVNIFISLLLAFLILKERRPFKKTLIYFVIGIFFLRNTTIVGVLTIYRMMVGVLFLKMILNWNYLLPAIKKYPFFLLSLLLLINHAFIGYMDSRLGFATTTGRFFFRFLSSFYLCLAGYIFTYSKLNLQRFINILYKIAFFTSLYSIIVLITKHDIISTLLGTYDSIDYGGRLRVSSFTGYGTNGFICAIIGVMCFLNPYDLLKVKQKWILFGLCFVTVFLSGFRINILILAAGILSLFVLKGRKYIKTFVVCAFLGIIAYLTVPYIQNFVDQTIGTFTGDEKIEGSSVEMRNMQYEAAYGYFLKSPLWGNGFSYFAENIAEPDDMYNGGLMGGEGYYILMLIEEGGIEIVLVSLFFILFLYFSLKKKDKYTLKPVLFSLMTMFIIYCLGTRPDDNWFYLFPILGAMTKVIVLEDENIRNNARIQCGAIS